MFGSKMTTGESLALYLLYFEDMEEVMDLRVQYQLKAFLEGPRPFMPPSHWERLGELYRDICRYGCVIGNEA